MFCTEVFNPFLVNFCEWSNIKVYMHFFSCEHPVFPVLFFWSRLSLGWNSHSQQFPSRASCFCKPLRSQCLATLSNDQSALWGWTQSPYLSTRLFFFLPFSCFLVCLMGSFLPTRWPSLATKHRQFIPPLFTPQGSWAFKAKELWQIAQKQKQLLKIGFYNYK